MHSSFINRICFQETFCLHIILKYAFYQNVSLFTMTEDILLKRKTIFLFPSKFRKLKQIHGQKCEFCHHTKYCLAKSRLTKK